MGTLPCSAKKRRASVKSSDLLTLTIHSTCDQFCRTTKTPSAPLSRSSESREKRLVSATPLPIVRPRTPTILHLQSNSAAGTAAPPSRRCKLESNRWPGRELDGNPHVPISDFVYCTIRLACGRPERLIACPTLCRPRRFC